MTDQAQTGSKPTQAAGCGQPVPQADKLSLAERFMACFGPADTLRFFRAPGRVELAGNHTDHQNGRVLCAAIRCDLRAAAAANHLPVIRLYSAGFPEPFHLNLSDLTPKAEEQGQTLALIRGIAAGFNRLRPLSGLDIYVASSLPVGSGLSSSAAFEVLLATVFDAFSGQPSLTPLQKAQLAQEAEQDYFGKPSGLMDQAASTLGGLLLLDFANPDQPQIRRLAGAWESWGYALLVTDTASSHQQLTAAYADVARDMRSVARLCGARVLGQVDPQLFHARLPALRPHCSDRALLRAMHFFGEQERVQQLAAALEAGDQATFFKTVRAADFSSRALLQNLFATDDPLKQPLSLALAWSDHLLAGSGASRVHGGGFGGTIQAYVPLQRLPDYQKGMEAVFGPGACRRIQISDLGAGPLEGALA